MALLNCYNKGCGQKYDPENNPNGNCIHHPGVPVFHDALKGWSCCKKRSTDFTEFLNIPGCTQSEHSNVKPPEPVKSEEEKTEQIMPKVESTTEHREPLEKKQTLDRPPANTPLTELKVTVGPTLVQALAKQMQDVQIEQTNGTQENDGVKVGTSCKNNGCKGSYADESSNTEECLYHPGVPIFHEGMKYWTCCSRKTSDFDNFLNQEGCNSGRHLWVKKEDPSKKVVCRQDWHQTGNNVIISVFSKVALPEQSWVRASPVALSAHITFDSGNSVYEKDITLRGIIDPARSSVKMVGTKVEITLRKAEVGSWPTLDLRTDNNAADSAS